MPFLKKSEEMEQVVEGLENINFGSKSFRASVPVNLGAMQHSWISFIIVMPKTSLKKLRSLLNENIVYQTRT